MLSITTFAGFLNSIIYITIFPVMAESILLARGQARNFTQIKWYHFPKSGGTTIRKRLHEMCQREGFNLTTNYGGLRDECSVIPFSCNKGKDVYIVYGHKQENAEFSSGNELNILMLREPLSWLLSRIQHGNRKTQKLKTNDKKDNGNTVSIVSAMHTYSGKYLMYTDTITKTLLMRWYEEARRDVMGNRSGLSSSTSSTTTLDSSSSSSSSGSAMRRHLEVTRRLQTLMRGNTLVLVMEHFEQSLRLLAHAFDSLSMLPVTNTNTASSTGDRQNQAMDWQEKVSVGSYSELKAVSRLLAPHQTLYQAAYDEFLRELEYANLT
eukprot:gene7826-16002_t